LWKLEELTSPSKSLAPTSSMLYVNVSVIALTLFGAISFFAWLRRGQANSSIVGGSHCVSPQILDQGGVCMSTPLADFQSSTRLTPRSAAQHMVPAAMALSPTPFTETRPASEHPQLGPALGVDKQNRPRAIFFYDGG